MKKASEIKKVASIYGGMIGGSWVTLFAMKGLETWSYGRNEDSIAKTKAHVDANFATLVEYGAIKKEDLAAINAKIHYTTSLEEACKDADFIQENGPERLDNKREALKNIEAVAPVDALIATSSSGIVIGEIVAEAAHPERVVGGHPYNPPHLIPLVEISYCEKTNKDYVDLAVEFYKSIDKEPVVLNKACPGFIANRLQLAVYREMMDLTMRGVCSAADADKALVYGPGIRWAIFGHNMIMQLGNPGGIVGMMNMLGNGGDVWLADMANWTHMPNAEYGPIAKESIDKMMAEYPDYIGHTNAECSKYRDKMLIDILKLHKKL